MTTELDPTKNSEQPEQTPAIQPDPQPEPKTVVNNQGGSFDGVYAFGLFGAWIYYISRAESVSDGLMGVLKGFVWPAILVHKLFVFFDEDSE